MFWKALLAGWRISQVSDQQRASIGRKAYARLRAIAAVIAWESEWVLEDGDIRIGQDGVGDWQYWECDFPNANDFGKLLKANAAQPLETLEQRNYEDCPERYEMDGRRISLTPTFNVKYRYRGAVVDLGAISA